MNNSIPPKKHALIKLCKIVLKKDEVFLHDIETLKLIIKKHLANGLSPSEIKKLYSIKYSDFGMFIKKCLGLPLKSVKDSVLNFHTIRGTAITEPKKIYKKECQFSFDPYSIPEIPGYKLLLEFGIYHPTKNPKGVCRDHMISIEFGWRNNIPSKFISNPSNCQFITNLDNIKKGSSSCLEFEELLKRIQDNKFEIVTNEYKKLSKTEIHKKKISITNSKFITITNGEKNLRISKNDPIPIGFRRGMIRKK